MSLYFVYDITVTLTIIFLNLNYNLHRGKHILSFALFYLKIAYYLYHVTNLFTDSDE